MMAKHTKKILAGMFALSCAFLLAGCDSYESLPNNYNDKVVAHEDGSDPDLYENEMGIIYDAIASGKTDKVIDEFLMTIATDQFGPYYDVVDDENNVIKKGVKSVAASSDEEVLVFVNAHKKAYCYDLDEKIATESYSVNQIRINRFRDFDKYVSKEINKVFYKEISGGTYNNDRALYQEERLAQAHYAEMYNIEHIGEKDYPWYESYITHYLDEDTVSDYVHIDNYKDYIERKIIPDIYKSRLVEEYIMENNYSVLGRAYGRKVNVLKIKHDAKNIDIADKLVQTFTDKYILNSDSKMKFSEFVDIINDAWRGFVGVSYNESTNTTVINQLDPTGESYLLLEEVLPAGSLTSVDTGSSFGVINYFKQTSLGELLEDYKLAIAAEGNRFATSKEEAALSKFTENGAHPKEDGLLKEIVALSKEDATMDGWYVKNGGLTDLPSDIRDRLFNINVSNAVDNFDKSETKDDHNYDPSKYVRYINNNYYLTPSKSQQAVVNPRNFVIHDDSSSSFYIVNVEEAPSTSKLNRENKDTGYIATDANVLKSESFAREISRVLGTRESYKNDAYASYIELYSVAYHDTTIYDYFKAEYPELFEDD